MTIQTRIRSEYRQKVQIRSIRQAARTTLDLEGADPQASLTIVITGNDEIQALNQRFRGLDEPTDVLSFGEGPTEDSFVDPAEEPQYLGDVVISFPQAQVQADEQGHSIQEELGLLVVHGVLHLLGYEHATLEEEADMWARQDRIIEAIEGKQHG